LSLPPTFVPLLLVSCEVRNELFYFIRSAYGLGSVKDKNSCETQT
jgi:hypothetical protein